MDSAGKKHVFRFVEGGTFPQDPRDSYDPEADWAAWRKVADDRSSPRHGDVFSDAAIDAAQTAVQRNGDLRAPRLAVDAENLLRAVALTSLFANVEVAWERVSPYGEDLIVRALNLYPHPASAACLWLRPALRNLLGGSRETPDELWNTWDEERIRLQHLSLHRWSPTFAGNAPRHHLLDYESGPAGAPLAREHLEVWQIRAHLSDVPKRWTFDGRFCRDARPPISAGRLNALTTRVKEVLSKPGRETKEAFTLEPFQRFLIRMAGEPDQPMADRRRFKECLTLVHGGLESGLLQRTTLRLEPNCVQEYESLLRGITMEWKGTARYGRATRLERRKRFVLERGWVDSPEAMRILEVEDIGGSTPKEVAALLLCMRERLGLWHFKTFASALSSARRAREAWLPQPPRTRRGRPAKPREFRPGGLRSD